MFGIPPDDARPSLHGFGAAAFCWAAAFALLSAYWALGGMVGADKLSPALRDQAERRETAFVVTLWITTLIKVIGGLIPLCLTFDLWSSLPRRLLSSLTWLGGGFLTLYGLGDIASGAFRALNGNDDGAIWYAVLWGPIWLIGGILFLGTAWAYRHHANRKS